MTAPNGSTTAASTRRSRSSSARPRRDFIAINEELHEKIVGGVNVSGPDGERERLVRFIGFEPG